MIPPTLRQKLATNKWIQYAGGVAYDITLPRAGYVVLDRASLRSENGTGVRAHEFGTGERLTTTDCRNDDPPAYHQSAPASVEFERPFIAEITNGRVVGDDGIVLTSDKEVVLESLYNADKTVSNPGGKLSTLKNLSSDCLPRTGRTTKSSEDVCCPLVNNWSHGYFHWIVDCLSRIEHLRYYEEETGQKPTVLVSSDPPRWKTASLRAAGYPPSDWERWDGSCRTFNRVLVPSLPRVGDYVAPRSVAWLADTVERNLNPSSGASTDRIYVSRRQCPSRYVVNESELLDALGEFGFESYVLEDLTFREQVELFSGAEFVIGPHGAGFTNTIFANDITLIELFGSSDLSHSLCYYGIASARGFDYAARRVPQQGAGLRPDPRTISSLVKELL